MSDVFREAEEEKRGKERKCKTHIEKAASVQFWSPQHDCVFLRVKRFTSLLIRKTKKSGFALAGCRMSFLFSWSRLRGQISKHVLYKISPERYQD